MDGPIWRLASPEDLAWREWEGELVVYHDGSGETHRLDGLAAEIFEALLEHPSRSGELVLHIGERLGIDDTAELRRSVMSALERFQALSLAEPTHG